MEFCVFSLQVDLSELAGFPKLNKMLQTSVLGKRERFEATM